MAGKFRKARSQKHFNKRGLILCEGETEAKYFMGLVSQEEHRRKFASVNVSIFKPKDHSPVGLIEKAKELMREAQRERNPYDFVWVVFDKDGHARIPDAFEMARTSRGDIKIAFSASCFEYFILMHFEKTTKPFDKCDDIVSHLRTNWIPDYEKAVNPFELLKPNMKTGLANSSWLIDRCNDEIENGKHIYEFSAFTNVHLLIEDLYSQVKIDITK